MQVQAATKSDIQAIMRMERTEGYASLVGRWEVEEHSTEIENPSCRYLVARDGTDVAAFAILQGVGSANRLRRIAVGHAGRGIGSGLLRSVLQICFEDLAANRVELFVFVDNERAYRTYLRTGFSEEGVVRDLHGTPTEPFDRCA
jgi:GNAT superfamily N-acetyltransferase